MQQENNRIHNIIMEGRKKLSVTGVSDIDSFNEQIIIAITSMGILTIKGENLHIEKINVTTGDLVINGKIISIAYSDSMSKKTGSAFKKLFN